MHYEIGMDVHKEAIVIAVLSGGGRLGMESIVETKASSIGRARWGCHTNLELPAGRI